MNRPQDTSGFIVRIEQYIEHIKVRGYSKETLKHSRKSLQRLGTWCEERGIFRPTEATRQILERYQRHMFYHVSPHTNRRLSRTTQQHHINSIRMFFKWMTRQNLIVNNPASELEPPRREQQLPRQFLTVEEVEKVMNQPDIRKPLGLRDRAVLEVLYSTAIRRTEAANLTIDDINSEHGIVTIRKGKNLKDRVVPIGERASSWLRLYLDEGRPRLITTPDDGFIFLNFRGKKISSDSLSEIARRHIHNSGIKKTGACHLFRHTCATQMLKGGANIRFIQAMLGHSNLNTTEIYTQVVITDLKKVHTHTHPAATLK